MVRITTCNTDSDNTAPYHLYHILHTIYDAKRSMTALNNWLPYSHFHTILCLVQQYYIHFSQQQYLATLQHSYQHPTAATTVMCCQGCKVCSNTSGIFSFNIKLKYLHKYTIEYSHNNLLPQMLVLQYLTSTCNLIFLTLNLNPIYDQVKDSNQELSYIRTEHIKPNIINYFLHILITSYLNILTHSTKTSYILLFL